VRRILVGAVLLLLGGFAGAQDGGKKQPNPFQPDDGTCKGDFGTAVRFVKTPSEAARQALKEEKLVFVLHVSGEFEEPDFT